MKKVLLALLLVFACISCEYPKPVFTEDMSQETRDSLTYLHDYHFTQSRQRLRLWFTEP